MLPVNESCSYHLLGVFKTHLSCLSRIRPAEDGFQLFREVGDRIRERLNQGLLGKRFSIVSAPPIITC